MKERRRGKEVWKNGGSVWHKKVRNASQVI